MAKLLEKTLKDAIKEDNHVIGTKQVISSIKSSKLVIISKSIPSSTIEQIEDNTKKENIPLLHFEGTSIMLGKLCGLQFRVSTISLKSLSNTNIQAILKESETK